jgi:hypothetical protein
VKREDDELRKILINLEASEDWRIPYMQVLSPSKEEDKFGYHLQLLCDAGFMTPISKTMFRMTSQGHDYLDAIRSDTNWNRTKEGAAAVGGMTLSMMKDLAVAYLKQEVAEKLGVSL